MHRRFGHWVLIWSSSSSLLISNYLFDVSVANPENTRVCCLRSGSRRCSFRPTYPRPHGSTPSTSKGGQVNPTLHRLHCLRQPFTLLHILVALFIRSPAASHSSLHHPPIGKINDRRIPLHRPVPFYSIHSVIVAARRPLCRAAPP